ncbi:MAG: DMT family transporter, partial [Hyphomicrobiaceae bacterium]
QAHDMTSHQTGSSFTRAVLTLLAAIFLFDIMGAIIKHLGGRYPTQQLAMFRNLFGLIPSILVLFYSKSWYTAGKPIVLRQWKLALLRGGFVVLAQFCFYLSLVHLEFATASTIGFSSPLFITALSIPLLGSRVGVWRWLAVFLGFAGVIMVMRPGSELFNWYAVLPLGAAFGYACISITARLFDDDAPTALINVYSLVGALAGSTALTFATSGFSEIQTVQDWGWLIAMGFAGGLAVFLLISAYRLTEPSNVSPFEYFGIPFSFAIGWIAFGEAPFDRLFPGVLFILAGGLLIVWREQALKVKTPDLPKQTVG